MICEIQSSRLQLSELPCVILCFSLEDDYQRNIYVPNICIETKSCRYEKKEQTCGQCHTIQYWSLAHFSELKYPFHQKSVVDSYLLLKKCSSSQQESNLVPRERGWARKLTVCQVPECVSLHLLLPPLRQFMIILCNLHIDILGIAVSCVNVLFTLVHCRHFRRH